MAACGSVTQVHQSNHFGPLPLQLWQATITVPAAATGVTVTAPNRMSGVAVAAWMKPTSTSNPKPTGTIKVYDATDSLATPVYIVNYTIPGTTVESHSLLNARARVMGTLTCVVAGCTAADSFQLWIWVDPNADDALNVAIGDISVDIDTDTLLLMGSHIEGTSVATTPSGVLMQGDTGGSDNKALNVLVDTNGAVFAVGSGLAGTPAGGVLTVQGVASMTPLLVTPSASSYGTRVSLTRTADVNAYTANDVVGAATGSTAALTFPVAPAGGGEVIITSSSLEIDVTAVPSGMTSFNLHLYNITPPSALGDNVAWDLPAGDRASYLGFLALGTPVDVGSTLYVEANYVKQITAASANIYGYLVTVGAYTPSSAAVKAVTLHTLRA